VKKNLVVKFLKLEVWWQGLMSVILRGPAGVWMVVQDFGEEGAGRIGARAEQ